MSPRLRTLPAVLALGLALFVLLPSAIAEPQFIDENFYVWSGRYYLDRLIRLDFSIPAEESISDPGWAPADDSRWWTLSAPLGFRLLYGTTTSLFGTAAPARPYLYQGLGSTIESQPEAMIPPDTLLVARLTATICSALGLSALALRFGWAGLLGIALVFLAPYAGRDLSRTMAEGPLIGSLGLAVLTFGTAWFPLALALGASSKLTALAIWPLLLWPQTSGRLRWFGLPVAVILWTILNPASWFAGGPLQLLALLQYRAFEYSYHTVAFGGFYLPTWYVLPVWYAGALLLATFLARRTLRRRSPS